MNRNTLVLILVAVLIGVANGLYQFVYPFFLQDIGISLGSMGIIFSVASVAMAIIGVILGWLSDLSGRKKYYSFSISLAFITTLVTPVMRRIWELTIVKILRDTSNSIRMALHPTLIYDYTKKGFTGLLARTQGLTSLMGALGTFASAYLLLSFGFNGTFFVCGIIVLVATISFTLFFTEKQRETKRITFSGLRNAFTWDIPRNLKFIAG
ncbi:MFS transporter, partial [Candidatus Bathyarchaeota archaeon]|nr:MFS transporter [Candidatus Bathyarchaeota archaeon]